MTTFFSLSCVVDTNADNVQIIPLVNHAGVTEYGADFNMTTFQFGKLQRELADCENTSTYFRYSRNNKVVMDIIQRITN
jgi:hypothetical protein